MGTPDFAAASLAALYDMENVELVGVFSQPDKPVGRKQILEPTPVKRLAMEHKTPVFQPTRLRDGAALEIIRSLDPELIVVVAYGRILPDEIWQYPRLGTINIHGSLLPKYRGAAPIQWARINGEAETGVTAMYLASAMDSGDMIAKKRLEILPEETSGDLFLRLQTLGAELLCETVNAIESGTAGREPQNEAEATFAPPLTKEMAEIDWTKSARLVISHIYGMDPWPVATAELGGVKFKIYRAMEEAYSGSKAPGTVLSADKRGILVACGEGAALITELQAPGGRRMAAADYLRGHPLCL